MNPLTTLLLADSRTADRLAAACLRASRTARQLALHTAQPMEPPDLPIVATGRRLQRAPRWWTVLESGETAATPVAAHTAAAKTQQASGCTAC